MNHISIKQLALTLLAFYCFSELSAQTRYTSLEEALLSAGKLSGGSGPRNVNWIDGGKRFSYIPAAPGAIQSFDPASGSDVNVFSAAGLTFPGTQDAFRYTGFQWSDDARFLVFQTNFRPVWRNSGDADYYLYDVAAKQLRLLAKDARTCQLSPDGQKVAYERAGNLFVFNLNSSKESQLTRDGAEGLYNGRFGWAYEEEFGLVQAWAWSPDSRSIAYWQSDERQVPIYQMSSFEGMHPEWEKIPYPRVGDPSTTVKIGVVDISKKKTRWMNVPLGDGYIPRIYWTSTPGQLALVHLNRAQNHLTLYMCDAANGAARPILEEKSTNGWVDIFDFFAGILHYFFFPEGSEEFFYISGESDHQHISRYDYNGKRINTITSGNWDVVTVEHIDSQKGLVYYTSTEVSPLDRHLYAIRFDGSGKKKLTEAPGRHSINFSPGGAYYIDSYSNVETPRQVALMSVEGKTVKVFEDNERVKSFVKEHAYAPRELFSFTTTDGQRLDGYMVKPLDFDAGKKYPLLVSIYGGPGSQGVYNSFGSSAWEQYLAQEGYVVVNVNNRGCGGYGQKFMEVVYKQLGKYESRDFVETARYLSANYSWIDGSRMAIQGHSYGGFSSSYTMLTHPGVFKAAIVAAPVTDHRLYDNIYTERYMGLIEDNAEGYVQSASVTHAGKLDGAMLIAHSTMDDNVHISHTYHLVKALTDARKDADLRIYPPGNHSVAYNRESYILLHQTYLNFLNRHLKP